MPSQMGPRGHALRMGGWAATSASVAVCVAAALGLLPTPASAAGAASGGATPKPGFVRGSDAGNCAVVPGANLGWSGARDLCASKGAGLPIIRAPRENAGLRAVLNASGVGGGAWVGLEDIGRVPVTVTSGGWRWADGTDGNFVGRVPNVSAGYNGIEVCDPLKD